VASKNYYDLFSVAPTASQEEVKRAFRQQIARYHPDKVQHLGKEFQEMAAERAAELTEAYRILSDEGRRAEYDRSLGTAPQTAPAPAAPAHAPPPAKPQSAAPAAESPASPPTGGAPRGAFTQERASRDEFVRKATIGRFRQALAAVGGDYDESKVRGFDIACVPKAKMFARNKGPRLFGRFVPRVDGAAVAEAWMQAGKSGVPANEEVCVFLMGSSVASPKELADAIAEQRRKTRAKVTLIPVDARDWGAHVPTDAPVVAKNLLARLRSGT
jgi:curved DNA-binding protein CbpA